MAYHYLTGHHLGQAASNSTSLNTISPSTYRVKRGHNRSPRRWLLSLIASAVMLSACSTATASQSGGTGTKRGTTVAPPHLVVTTDPKHTRVFHNVFDPSVIDASSGIYLGWVFAHPGSAQSRSAVVRIDRANAKVLSTNVLAGSIEAGVATNRHLWITSSNAPSKAILYEFNADNLTLTRTIPLIGTDPGTSMATTNSYLWVSEGDQLLRIDRRDANLRKQVKLTAAFSATVSTDTQDHLLVVAIANRGGQGRIEIRSGANANLIGTSASLNGVFAPRTAAVGKNIWISEATGNMGYVSRYRLRGLTPTVAGCPSSLLTNSPTCILGSNGLQVNASHQLIFLSQVAGGGARNACIDPSNGSIVAQLPLAPTDQLLTIGHSHLFVMTQTRRENVVELPIPSACLGG